MSSRHVPAILAIALLAACGGGTTDTDTPDTDGDTLDALPDAVGDYACAPKAASYAEATFVSQAVDPAKVGDVTLDAVVVDFQEDETKDKTTVSLWFDNDPSGDADVSETNAADGTLTLDARSCDPLTWLALRQPSLEDARPTYKAHQVYPPSSGGAVDAEFTNVSENTYLLIPSVLRITPDETRSIIAGTAFDCTRDPTQPSSVDAGKAEGIQVEIKDAEGNTPEGVQIRYYVEKFPSETLNATSPDGLWTAINVPVGTYRVEMWGKVDGARVLLGASSIKSVANSINIANLFAGYDEIKYPDDCLVAE